MKVGVIGPGAMGCLFAARLKSSGAKVYLVDHNKERANQLDKSGVIVETEVGELHEHPTVVVQQPPGLDLIILLTKAYSTRDVRFPPDVPVLTLQNGLGNIESLCAALGSARVLAGVTTEAATLLDVGRVRHVAAGKTQFGAWTSAPAEPAEALLREAGFNCEITDSPGKLIWEKLSLNAGINPLTALLNVPNGQLLEQSEVRQLMRDLVVEAAKVASTEGYRFDHSLVEVAEETCRATHENISSMLQDVRAKKQTEIDAISGEILRRAQMASLPTPRTRVIYQLMRGLEGR
jgi:2-dehydropantoate 2-reductase